MRQVIGSIREKFDGMEDSYLRGRGADIEPIPQRLLRTLLGVPELSSGASDPGTIGIGSALSLWLRSEVEVEELVVRLMRGRFPLEIVVESHGRR